MDASLAELKKVNAQPMSKSEQTDDLIKKAQQRLMQIFLLDRENERLLASHKGSAEAQANLASIKSESRSRLQKAYEEYSVDEPSEDESGYSEGNLEDYIK